MFKLWLDNFTGVSLDFDLVTEREQLQLLLVLFFLFF